jgi:hypothetical protein
MPPPARGIFYIDGKQLAPAGREALEKALSQHLALENFSSFGRLPSSPRTGRWQSRRIRWTE